MRIVSWSFVVVVLCAGFGCGRANLLATLWRRQLQRAEAPESSPAEASSSRAKGGGGGKPEFMPYMAALDPQASSTHCNITSQCIPCTHEQQDNEAACRATGFHQEITCIESFGAHRASGSRGPRGEGAATVEKGSVKEDEEGEGEKGGKEGESVLKDAGEQGEGDAKEEKGDEEGSKDGEAGEGSRGKEGEGEVKGKVGRSLRSGDEAGERENEDPGTGDSVASTGSEASSDGEKAGSRQRSGVDAQGHSASEHRQGFRKYVTFESCSPVEEETLSVVGFEAIMLSLLAVCAPVVYQRKRKATVAVAMTRMPSGSRV